MKDNDTNDYLVFTLSCIINNGWRQICSQLGLFLTNSSDEQLLDYVIGILFSGVVLKESKCAYNDEEDRHFMVASTFNKFTSWNLNSKPNLNDKIRLALDWIDLADSVS